MIIKIISILILPKVEEAIFLSLGLNLDWTV